LKYIDRLQITYPRIMDKTKEAPQQLKYRGPESVQAADYSSKRPILRHLEFKKNLKRHTKGILYEELFLCPGKEDNQVVN
jgi:hypothetical protein